jgi:hypothetical protein
VGRSNFLLLFDIVQITYMMMMMMMTMTLMTMMIVVVVVIIKEDAQTAK